MSRQLQRRLADLMEAVAVPLIRLFVLVVRPGRILSTPSKIETSSVLVQNAELGY